MRYELAGRVQLGVLREGPGSQRHQRKSVDLGARLTYRGNDWPTWR